MFSDYIKTIKTRRKTDLMICGEDGLLFKEGVANQLMDRQSLNDPFDVKKDLI